MRGEFWEGNGIELWSELFVEAKYRLADLCQKIQGSFYRLIKLI